MLARHSLYFYANLRFRKLDFWTFFGLYRRGFHNNNTAVINLLYFVSERFFWLHNSQVQISMCFCPKILCVQRKRREFCVQTSLKTFRKRDNFRFVSTHALRAKDSKLKQEYWICIVYDVDWFHNLWQMKSSQDLHVLFGSIKRFTIVLKLHEQVINP